MPEYTKKVVWVQENDTDFATFRMGIKGGKLPAKVDGRDFEASIDVRLSIHGVEIDKRVRDYTVAAWRIAFQKMLRDECGVDVIIRLEKDGFACNIATPISESMVLTKQDKIAMMERFVKSLPEDEQEELIERLVNGD